MLGVRTCDVLLGGKTFKGVGDDPRTQSLRDLARAVRRVGIDHHNLIGTGERANGAGDVRLFIVGDDRGRNGWHGGLELAIGDDGCRAALGYQFRQACNVGIQGTVRGDVR